MLANYDFVSKETLAYFSQRPPQAKRDSEWALAFVKTHAKTRDEQDAVIKALEFKCSVLWTQLDALWTAYVDKYVPPGAWEPGTSTIGKGRAA
jgi:coenzyme PQQ biosynthesis protein C